MSYILAIDQGTSSTKCLVFNKQGQAVAKGSEPLQTNYFDNGFVEQDPEIIYANVLAAVKNCFDDLEVKGYRKEDISCIGISNQRETFVLWDKNGEPLHPAVVWQCKRSVKVCEELKNKVGEETIRQKTGLVIDPYFSATKLIWLIENNKAIKDVVNKGEAFFGTIDSWLLYKLTDGKSFYTDHTNASRTLLFNIHTLNWDDELIEIFGFKGLQLPSIKSSSYNFGETNLGGMLSEPVPITGMLGDSHAAAFGEGCFDAGTAKATLGTGCSILMNIGDQPSRSRNGMVTTICWSSGDRVDYALEGVIVTCGATIEWLKNELGFFDEISETEAMALSVSNNGGVYLIPAFSGLGSPHWQMDRRASVSGLSFGATKNHIVRAALESIPYQIKDVIAAMEKDTGVGLKELMTNGGLTSNKFVMNFLADLLEKPINSSTMPDVSALGAALMAGLGSEMFRDIADLKELKFGKNKFTPSENRLNAQKGYEEWLKEIAKN